MAHYSIFREELAIAYPTYGSALWEPDPGGQYNAVEVGDVGFIRRGYFQRLFNVLHPKDHPSHRNPSFVPEDHQQLQTFPDHIVKNEIRTGSRQNSLHFSSQYVTLESRGRGTSAAGPEDDSEVTFSCYGKQGALLSLPVPAQGEDTVAFGDFGKWMIKHIDTWFAFARGLGLGINRMEDIILVTGRHLTKSWVNVAFTQRRRDSGVSFDVQVSSHGHVALEQQYVHGGDLKLGPTGRDLPRNQCIFVRGFRVARILGMWPRLRGQAGPAPNAGDDESEPEFDTHLELIGVPGADGNDPIHDLLQHIAKQAPDCDMALIHDNDLACIDGVLLKAIRTHKLIEVLPESGLTIQQFHSDLLPGNMSGPGADVAVAKVATLSRHAFETPRTGSESSDLNFVLTPGAATERSAPEASLPAITSVPTSSRLDKTAYEAEQKRIETLIDSLQDELAAVKSNLALQRDLDNNTRQTALPARLEDLELQHSNNKISRNEILYQIETLHQGIQKKKKDLQVSRENAIFRTVEDVDTHIRNLEEQVESARQEIDHARHIRKTVENFQADSDALDAEHAAIEELRKRLGGPEVNATSERDDVIMVEAEEIETDDVNADSKLFEERQRRQLFSEPRESTSWFNEDNERYYTKPNEDRIRYAERWRPQRKAEDAPPGTPPHGRSGPDGAAKRERPEVHGDERGDERTTTNWKGAAGAKDSETSKLTRVPSWVMVEPTPETVLQWDSERRSSPRLPPSNPAHTLRQPHAPSPGSDGGLRGSGRPFISGGPVRWKPLSGDPSRPFPQNDPKMEKSMDNLRDNNSSPSRGRLRFGPVPPLPFTPSLGNLLRPRDVTLASQTMSGDSAGSSSQREVILPPNDPPKPQAEPSLQLIRLSPTNSRPIRPPSQQTPGQFLSTSTSSTSTLLPVPISRLRLEPDEESTPPNAPRLPRPVDISVFSQPFQESDTLLSPLSPPTIIQEDNTLRAIQHLLDGQSSSEEDTMVMKPETYVSPHIPLLPPPPPQAMRNLGFVPPPPPPPPPAPIPVIPTRNIFIYSTPEGQSPNRDGSDSEPETLWQKPIVEGDSLVKRPKSTGLGPPSTVNIGQFGGSSSLKSFGSSEMTLVPSHLIPPPNHSSLSKDFFPDHDLDKPVIEESLPAPLPYNSNSADKRSRHKKSIRIVTEEHNLRQDKISQKQSSSAANVFRKRSTKLWGSRVEEVTPGQITSGVPSMPDDLDKPEGTFQDSSWALRPNPEEVLDRLQDFFPDHDLDKPVIEESPPAPLPYKSNSADKRSRHKKSIRIVAEEHNLRQDKISQKQSGSAANVFRKRSTKLWDSRVEEITPGQITLGMPSIPDPPSASGTSAPKPIFKWVRGELIGKGNFGRVYLALNATTGEMIAVKQVEVPIMVSDKGDTRQVTVVEALKLESETLKDLDHPNIVQYLGFEETPSFLSIFLEYVPGGSVGSCLRKFGRFEENVTKYFAEQILSGLEYLHSKGILHRDLKADNILVEKTGVCKISDFGLSKRTNDIDEQNVLTAMQGTVFWMAPEVVNTGKRGYNSKVDIWSVGCVVLEMWAGERPWREEEAMAVIVKLYSSKQAPPIPSGVTLSPQADDFRKKCFALDPDARPSAAELRKHQYLIRPPGWVFRDFGGSQELTRFR